MLTRKTPETFSTTLHVKGQGVSDFKFNVTYFNRTQDEAQAVLDAAHEDERSKTDPQFASRQSLLHVVKEWESEYELTDADVKAMEDARPGMMEIIFIGYHKARRVEVAKN